MDNNSQNLRRSKKTTKKSFKNSLAVKVLFLTMLLVAGASIYAKGITDRLQKDQTTDGMEPIENQPFNILLLGKDAADFETPGRTDTILVVNIDPVKKKAFLVSVPRDTKVRINGRSSKINAAYAKGGADLTAQKVQELLDIKISRYFLVNWGGFENLVDLVGGVVIDVEKRMHYRGAGTYIELNPGKQLLNGKKALMYVRFRNDRQGDIGRMPRQQKFVFAFIDQSKQFKNILKLPQLIDGIVENVRTNSSSSELLWLGKSFWGFTKTDLKSEILPGAGKMVNGVSYFVLNDDELPAVSSKLGWETKKAFESRSLPIAANVYNAGDIEGLANTVSQTLGNKGYMISEVKTARRKYRNTTIFYGTNGLEKAKLTSFYLSKRFSSIELVESPDINNNADLSIYIGKKGVQPVASTGGAKSKINR